MDDQSLLDYSRHILLPEIDIDGQQALLDAHVLIIGLGGLGSPVALYLAAAGVGELTLVDDDEVDGSNLQRQIIHTRANVGLSKVASAKAQIAALSPRTRVNALNLRLDDQGLLQQTRQAQVVVDCTDNFASRFAINQASVHGQVPLVSGAAIRFEGQIAVFDPRDGQSPCYQCLYQSPDDDLNCSSNGVLSPLVGIIGSLQALEVIRLIAPFGESAVGKLRVFDGMSGDWRALHLKPDALCPICRNREVIP